MAKLVHIANPVVPTVGARVLDVLPGETVEEAIRRSDWRLPPSTVLLRNDLTLLDALRGDGDLEAQLVPRAQWSSRAIGPCEDAVLVTVYQGGGGGASNPLQIVAQIALIVVAHFLAGPLGDAIAGSLDIGLTIAHAIATVVILTAGKFLISALLPAPGQKKQPTASPTYALNGQSNQARLGSPIPEMFGHFNMVCDLAAAPFFDYQDNNQQLYMLFAQGRGLYQFEQFRIGTNVIAEADDSGVMLSTGAYPEIEWEIIPPGGSVTLFPDNVVSSSEVSAIEVLGTNQDGYDWTAWFVCNPPNTLTNKLAFDVALPAGLFHTDSDGGMHDAEVSYVCQAQLIDDAGDSLADPIEVLNVTLDMSTVTPQRMSNYAQVDQGRWRARMQRTNRKATKSSTQDTLVWVALRAFMPPVYTFGDVTLIAIRASATKNLNAISAQSFNTVSTRMLPIWDAEEEAWSDPVPTRSIAWAAAYVARKKFTDGRIDIAWLTAYDAIWAARGDTFDGIFDTPTGFLEGLNAILNTGRSQAIYTGSKLIFTRDEPKTVYSCGFSPRSMLPNSFQRNHQFFNEAEVDALLVQYIDQRDWRQHQVLCKLPESTATVDTATPYQVIGFSDYAHAWREGIFKIASARYRRISASFGTHLQGRVCFRGQLIKLAHWSANWGASADVLAIEHNEGGDILTLSEPWCLNLDAEGERIIILSTPDGYLSGVVPINLLDDGQTSLRARVQLTDSAAPTQGLYTGLEPRQWDVWTGGGLQLERPRVSMGQGTQAPQDALVVSMTPSGARQCTINAIIEDPRVHEADLGDPPPEPSPPQNPDTEDLTITGLHIQETLVTPSEFSPVVVTVTASGAPDAITFDYRMKWNGAHDWTSVTTDNGRTFQFNSSPGSVELQVRGVDSGGKPGDWFEQDFEADGKIDIVDAMFDFSEKTHAINLLLFQAHWT